VPHRRGQTLSVQRAPPPVPKTLEKSDDGKTQQRERPKRAAHDKSVPLRIVQAADRESGGLRRGAAGLRIPGSIHAPRRGWQPRCGSTSAAGLAMSPGPRGSRFDQTQSGVRTVRAE